MLEISGAASAIRLLAALPAAAADGPAAAMHSRAHPEAFRDLEAPVDGPRTEAVAEMQHGALDHHRHMPLGSHSVADIGPGPAVREADTAAMSEASWCRCCGVLAVAGMRAAYSILSPTVQNPLVVERSESLHTSASTEACSGHQTGFDHKESTAPLARAAFAMAAPTQVEGDPCLEAAASPSVRGYSQRR